MDESQGLALGAADYITKPINVEIARLRILNLLERERQRKEIAFYRDRLAALVVERSQALAAAQNHEAQLASIAYYDPLTGVPNRRLLMDRLNQAIALTQRLNCMLAICYLDLDGFKLVNDQLGHDAGDQLLIEFTCRLKNILRQCDTLAVCRPIMSNYLIFKAKNIIVGMQKIFINNKLSISIRQAASPSWWR